MKLAILIFLLATLGSIKAQSDGYIQLSTAEIQASQLIQDLNQLGSEYFLDKAIFQDTSAPLLNGGWNIEETESVYRKISGGITSYKFTVILESDSSHTVIRATYRVSFRPSNGETIVTCYRYAIISDESEEYIYDFPSFIDTRRLGSTPYYDEKLARGFEFTVTNAIANGQITDAIYHNGITFSVKDRGYTDPYQIHFLTTLVASDGYTYRARIIVPDLTDTPVEEHGNHPITYEIFPNS